MRLRHALIASLLVASVALVGCSSNGSDGAAKEDPTTTAAPDGGATTTAAEGGGGGAETVDIVDFAFDPDSLEVKVGDTVTFTNSDSATHTATAEDDAPEAFNTDDIEGGAEAEVTFDTAGDYAYICSIHDYMTGTVTVSE